MTDKEAVALLQAVLDKNSLGWYKDHLDRAVFRRERTYSTVEFSDLGAGGGSAAEAFRKEWPDAQFSYDTEGGCDSCGYGELVTFTFKGGFPWEI